MPPIEGNEEEVQEEKELKILTSNKLWTRLPILFGQIKAENNLNKLKNEIGEVICLLYQRNKVTEKV